MLYILYIAIGVAAVLHGADRLTDGACALAQRLGVPEIVIGLTVVAMGTSLPEFVVSFVSAIKGTADFAVGNVVGSNIFNTTLIVGTAAVASPIAISHATVKKDIPFAVASAALLALLCLDGGISRADGAILFAAFIVFMAYTLRMAAKGGATAAAGGGNPIVPMAVPKTILFVFMGLIELIVGGNLFVSGASGVARILNISDAVIALTIVAGGTSLPELATTLVAARKGRSAMAIGNVVGSNVFNILMIMGVTSLVSPLRVEGITPLDMAVMLLSVVLLWLMSYTKYTLERWEGALLAALFLAYMSWLVHSLH